MPFLDKTLFDPDQPIGLYRRMLSPDHPGLIFAGLVQPIGPTIPLVEHQARWLAAMLAGDIRLPDRATQLREIARHHNRQRRSYLDTARYALEVDFKTYIRQMAADRRRGRAGT